MKFGGRVYHEKSHKKSLKMLHRKVFHCCMIWWRLRSCHNTTGAITSAPGVSFHYQFVSWGVLWLWVLAFAPLMFVALVLYLVRQAWACLFFFHMKAWVTQLHVGTLRLLCTAVSNPAFCFLLWIFAYKGFFFATLISCLLLGPNSAPHVTGATKKNLLQSYPKIHGKSAKFVCIKL